MTKPFELLKRATTTLVSTAFVLGLLFVVSCDDGGDEPEPEMYDLSGVYTFNKAILKTEITMPFQVIPGVPLKVPADTDITDEMAGGLLEEAPCDNPENGAVELKANKQLFFVCIGESNSEQAGTWDVDDDRTELSLILSVAIGTLELTIEELTIDENNDIIGGKIANFPINKALLGGFMAGFGLSEEQIVNILGTVDDNWTAIVDVEIEFKKEVSS